MYPARWTFKRALAVLELYLQFTKDLSLAQLLLEVPRDMPSTANSAAGGVSVESSGSGSFHASLPAGPADAAAAAAAGTQPSVARKSAPPACTKKQWTEEQVFNIQQV